jgi:hypothetical protein
MMSGNRFGTSLTEEPASTSPDGNAAGNLTPLPTYCSGFSIETAAVTILLG